MIHLEGVTKRYKTRIGHHTVLNDVTFDIKKGEKVGVLGRNGAGKSTLIRLISGAELPTKGRVVRKMSASWPLALGDAFQGSLTGVDNTRFICRVYGADIKKVLAYVEDFAELGKFLREPVKTYSSGMRSRLAFAISMAVEFDCFLIDEVISVGDSRFSEKCNAELFVKRADRAMIIVSHEPDRIRAHCTRACVLSQGKIESFDTVDAAYSHYQALQAANQL
jgi:capsular polysaccharide transport system ATP-binding protein